MSLRLGQKVQEMPRGPPDPETRLRAVKAGQVALPWQFEAPHGGYIAGR
jgi:hypothetical protein